MTIPQSCLGAYLYSAGTQHRNLLKLLVMTSMVKNERPHEHWAEIYKQKPLVILKKTHLFQSFRNNLYRTRLISSNNKRDVHSKMTPPFCDFHRCDSCSWQSTAGMAAIIWKHWLVEKMRVWGVYSAAPAAGHGWDGKHQQGWGSF